MVERNDRRDRISETEGRKENKLLYFIVQTIGCNNRLADASENNVHSVGHDRHQRLRDNGRKTDGIDCFDDPWTRLHIFQTVCNLFVLSQMENES